MIGKKKELPEEKQVKIKAKQADPYLLPDCNNTSNIYYTLVTLKMKLKSKEWPLQ